MSFPARCIGFVLLLSIFASLTLAEEPAKISDEEISADFEKIAIAGKPELEALITKYGDLSNIETWYGVDIRRSIASRLRDVGDLRKAIEILKPLVSIALPEDQQKANSFAQSWPMAIDLLAELSVGPQASSELFEELQALQERPCCFAQKIAYSQAYQTQTSYVSLGTIDPQLVGEEYAKLQAAFPDHPHFIALDLYLNYLRSISSLMPQDKIAASLNLIRTKAMEAVNVEDDVNQLFGYFRVLCSTSSVYAAMILLKESPKNAEELSKLVSELDSCCDRVSQKLTQKMGDDAKGTLTYIDSRRANFHQDIKRQEERANLLLNNKLRFIVSDLRGRTAPKFEGESILRNSLSDSSSPSFYLLSFWQTSNPLCIKRMADLNELHEKYHASGFRVIGIISPAAVRWSDKDKHLVADSKSTHEERTSAIAEFCKKCGCKFSQMADEGSIRSSFEVKSFPTYVVIGRNGIVKVVAGDNDETFDAIKQVVQKEARKSNR